MPEDIAQRHARLRYVSEQIAIIASTDILRGKMGYMPEALAHRMGSTLPALHQGMAWAHHWPRD